MTQDASNFTPIMLESPFSGDFLRNHAYWSAANMHAILTHHEAPMSSHFYYTQFLNDQDPASRALGISLGFAMWKRTERIVFYMDLGESRGMKEALRRAQRQGLPIQQRWIGMTWETLLPSPIPEWFRNGPRGFDPKAAALQSLQSAPMPSGPIRHYSNQIESERDLEQWCLQLGLPEESANPLQKKPE